MTALRPYEPWVVKTGAKPDTAVAAATAALRASGFGDPAVEQGTLTADYNLFFNPSIPYSDTRSPAHDVRGMDPDLANPVAGAPFALDEVGVWKRTTTVRDILGVYRTRYTPQAGSPVIDTGDPAGGSGNDIGAVGAGQVNAADRFGQL